MRRVFHALAAGILAAAVCAAGGGWLRPAAAEKSEPWQRNWSMHGANAERSFRVDVEPIRAQPRVAWELDAAAMTMLAAPVVWEGAVFVYGKAPGGKVAYIHALDARTGAVRAKGACHGMPEEGVELFASQGICLVSGPERTQAWALRGEALKKDWDKPLVRGDSALVWKRGFVCDAGLVELRNGSPVPAKLGSGTTFIARVGESGDADLISLAFGLQLSPTLEATVTRIAGTEGDARTWKMTNEADERVLLVASDKEKKGLAPMSFVEPGKSSPGVVVVRRGGWMTANGTPASMAVWTPSRGVFTGRAGLVEGVKHAAAGNDGIYAWHDSGDVLRIGWDGLIREFLNRKQHPAGSWTGWVSTAKDVVYPGNWAIDLTSMRVAWVHAIPATEKMLGPLIPAGDGLALLRTDRGRMICLADPRVVPDPSAAPGVVSSGSGGTSESAKRPDLPGAGDGAYTRDGRWVAGTPSAAADGGVIVTAAQGAPVTVAAANVAAAVAGGRRIACAPQPEVWDLVRRSFEASWADALLVIGEEALRLELPDEAQRCADEARNWGLDPGRAEEFGRRLTGRRTAANADLRMNGLRRFRAPHEAAACEAGERCVTLLRAAGLPAAAAAMADRIAVAVPDWKGLGAALSSTLPAELSALGVPGQATGVQDEWRAWAPWLAASDGRFLPADAPEWGSVKGSSLASRSLAVRTPNVLLFTAATAAATAGPCALRAEVSIRSLETLLGGRPTTNDGRPLPPEAPLVVRLLADKAAYLAEAGDMTNAESTMGFYSPAENVSRFYVPGKDETILSEGRTLFSVLAHELTHHWVDARWLGYRGITSRRTVSAPGYWIVEGLATFVEDQVVDADTRGLTFADSSVRCVDITHSARLVGYWFSTEALARRSQAGFHQLERSRGRWLRLSRGRMILQVHEANLFYATSGALVHFMQNERGDDGRARLRAYVLAHYSGRSSEEPWKELGFVSAAALNEAFDAWIARVYSR